MIIFSIVAVLMFTGDVSATAGDDALTVESTYYDTVILPYDKMDSIEYRESGNLGTRQFGYGSVKLSLGIFKNDELGSYTRYTYNATKSYILITSEGKALVINLATDGETKALYDELMLKIGE